MSEAAESERYVEYGLLGRGGQATVHLGLLHGAKGFKKPVAIKRLHATFARDPEFVRGLIEEAHVAVQVRHPNVVPMLDVVERGDEVLLVMDYVEGESLARILATCAEAGEKIPPSIAVALVIGALTGLHAAHETKGMKGEPLAIVHRDVSPQNILVGADGVARVLDFGIAKAMGRHSDTRSGEIKGKVGYLAPEQLSGGAVSRAVDVWAMGVVLWEALAGRRLFRRETEAASMAAIVGHEVPPLSEERREIDPALDAAVGRALAARPEERFSTAAEMAAALAEGRVAPLHEVATWIHPRIEPALLRQREIVESALSEEVARPSAIETKHAKAEATVANVEASTAPPKRPRIVALSLLGGFLVFGLGALTLFNREKTPQPAQEPPLAAAAEPMPAPPASQSVDPPVLPSTAALETQDAAAPHVRRPPAHAPRSPFSHTANCNPPYTYDSSGNKIFKRECFAR